MRKELKVAFRSLNSCKRGKEREKEVMGREVWRVW